MAAKGQSAMWASYASKESESGLLPRAWSHVATAPDRVRYKASLVPFGSSVAVAIDEVPQSKSEEKKACTDPNNNLLCIRAPSCRKVAAQTSIRST